MAEAIPCNEVHDDSHRPVAGVDRDGCDPPSPKPLSDLLLHCAASGVRALEVDLDGWVEGKGDTVLELRKVDIAESWNSVPEGEPLSTVSNSSSMEIRRRFLGRRVADVLAPWRWVFMAVEANVA